MGIRLLPAGVALLIFTMLGVGCSSARAGSGTQISKGLLAPVARVTDGDTIHVTFQGHDERVRLIGIDSPEVPWYGGRGECFGVEAGLYARDRLAGRSVRLAFDVDRRDRYDRLLAYVYVKEELFNLTLVRLGYARTDPVPPDTRMAAELARVEGEAREAGRGLWSACR